MKYTAICATCGEVEIDKPMAAPFPVRHSCGCLLTRRYTPIAVHFAAAGFYSTDVDHFKKQIGPDRFAKFEAQKANAQQRGRTGKLTNYEKVLESV